MQSLSDDEGSGRLAVNCGVTALTVRPASGVGWAACIRKNDLARLWLLYLTGKRLKDLLAGRGPDFQAGADHCRVKDRDRDRLGKRNGIAQVDERMKAR